MTTGNATLDVCLATRRFHPDYSGSAVRFQRYAPGLRSRDVQMRVLTGRWISAETADGGKRRSVPWIDGELLPVERVDGIPVQRVRITSSGARLQDVVFWRALARYCRQRPVPDVVNVSALPIWSIPWLLQLRRSGIPIVHTVTMVRDPSMSRMKLRAIALVDRLVDCVVASTTVMRDALREEGVRGRIEVISNGVDLQRFYPVISPSDKLALRRHLQLDPEGELIVFVGGFLNQRKGIDVLADAWQLLAAQRPRAQLVLIGPQVNPFEDETSQAAFVRRVEASLDASGARNRVVSPGTVSNVEHYLQVADVFVFPSRREGMGNVVLEAFGCGAPTVLTPFVGRPTEFGRPGEQYLLTERKPRALAEMISTLLDDPAQREALSREARRWAERELDVERSLDRYAGLYRELTERSRRTARAHTLRDSRRPND